MCGFGCIIWDPPQQVMYGRLSGPICGIRSLWQNLFTRSGVSEWKCGHDCSQVWLKRRVLLEKRGREQPEASGRVQTELSPERGDEEKWVGGGSERRRKGGGKCTKRKVKNPAST